MGEKPSYLLGSLLVTAFAQAAEERATLPEAERHDFTLYVDEFQTYATNSFATILSESRKYRLSLVTANQFLGQVPELLRYAIIGNVGTIICFRIGAFDAPVLSKELGIPEDALINLANFEARVKRIASGSPTEAMHLRTVTPVEITGGRLESVIKKTRARNARYRFAEQRHRARSVLSRTR